MNYRLHYLLACLGGVSLLTSCASLSPEECLAADWRAIGYEDGLVGSAGRLAAHRKACAKVSVTPDLDEYERGRTEGVRRFCIPTNGFEAGRQGRQYEGVCPSDLESAFLEAFEDGRALYALEQIVDDIEDRIDDIERDIEQDEDAIRDLERELVDNPGDANNRQRLVDDIRRKSRDTEAHRIELVVLNRDLVAAERDLDDYLDFLGDSYR